MICFLANALDHLANELPLSLFATSLKGSTTESAFTIQPAYSDKVILGNKTRLQCSWEITDVIEVLR